MSVCEVDDQMVPVSVCEYYPCSMYTLQYQLEMEMAPQQEEVVVKAEAGGRKKKKKGISIIRKRKLSEEQVNVLEESFRHEYKLDTERKHRLASQLGIDPRQVAVWFQNRRARWKTNNLEHDFLNLKTQHHTTLQNISQLQTQVLKLKAELSDAQNEIRSLLQLNSPTTNSSFSIHPHPPDFLGEFALGGLETLFYSPQINYNLGFEWLA